MRKQRNFHWLRGAVQPLGPVLLVGVLLLLTVSGCGNRISFRDYVDHSGTHTTKNPTREQSIEIARNLYDAVWKNIYLDYVDSGFNGQDWGRWRHHYDNQLEDLDDAQVAISSMLASLGDEYTRYLPPRDMKEQTLKIDSHLFGVGIQIAKKNGKIVVVAPMPDTPASKAGVRSKDEIVTIDKTSTAGMSLEDAADHIRGEEGTTVSLTLKRASQRITLSMQRAEIKIQSVFTRDFHHPNVGYIRLNSFIGETVPQEMLQAFEKFQDKPGIILDLRGNYGGLLENAVEISEMLMEKGDIVSMSGRSQLATRHYKANGKPIFTKELVLLIDGGSASASEILSGAMKDNHRAVLIGTKTFGKGLVQKIVPLDEGAGLNITISKYFTPKGTDINKKGIEPDVHVSFTPQSIKKNHDLQLQAALGLLARRLGETKPVETATLLPD